MKQFYLAAIMLISAASLNAQTSNQNALKLNPLSLVAATGNVAYERAVGANKSIQLGGFYSGVSVGGLKYSGYGITPEMRFYFAGAREALNGVYAAPFLRYQSFNLKDKETSDKTSYNSIGGGATIGWQKMWPSGFVLDIFAGPSYNNGKFKTDGAEDDFDLSFGIDGFGLRTGITLGFGF
jgi:hypothetical protein